MWHGCRADVVRCLIVSRASLSCEVLLQVLPHVVPRDYVIALNKSFCRLIRVWVYEYPQSYSFPVLGRASHRALSHPEVNSKPTTSVHIGLCLGIVLGDRFCYLFELKNIRWSVFCPYNRFDEFPPNSLDSAILRLVCDNASCRSAEPNRITNQALVQRGIVESSISGGVRSHQVQIERFPTSMATLGWR
jgi:hypothetical protein